MATNGNDILTFSGQMAELNFTLVNPYSSKEFEIDDDYNVNDSSYDGLAGIDTLTMSSGGEALFLTNNVGMQVVLNIEIIQAGAGGDIINMAHADIEYDDLIIFGGPGDDILWSNVGEDFIRGADGDDIIDGGPGDDDLLGDADNDQIFGGEGNDFIDGGSGDDILYGGTDLRLRELDKEFEDTITFPDLQNGVDIVNLLPPGTSSLGLSEGNLSIDHAASATLTFRDGHAGYNNTLGIYSINEDDGTIENLSVLWGNVKTADLDTDYTIDIPVGEAGGDFGFFIIANGFKVNGKYADLDITGEGNVHLIYDYGGANERAATVNDSGTMISTVYNDGTTEVVLDGPVYHTTARGGDNSINPDGMTHVVSGLADDGSDEALRIGFEDLPNLGDADFEDVLFDLDIQEEFVDISESSETGQDTIFGGAGNDTIYGEGGGDFITMGNGLDHIYGGSGRDLFTYDIGDDLVDVFHDFEEGFGGDKLNLYNILDYDNGDDALDFVQLINNEDGDTELHINADGDQGGDFTQIAVFEGGLESTVQELIDNVQLAL